jgi:hypothetical protein
VRFVLSPFDPCPVSTTGPLEHASRTNAVVALETAYKYQFVDEAGHVAHEYALPTNPDIQNCGAYVDKLIKYRDPKLFEHFKRKGVNAASLKATEFPILDTRSPELDLLLFQLIQTVRHSSTRLRLLDHGCSVAEHIDLLDVMMTSVTGERIFNVVDYHGLDFSMQLLLAARFLHSDYPKSSFSLTQAEGSDLNFADDAFDFCLSVGVINQVAEPVKALKSLLRATSRAVVMAIWVTDKDRGFWAVNHARRSYYFFSFADLAEAAKSKTNGAFHVVRFIPETQSSQQKMAIGIGSALTQSMGCYHLVFTSMSQLPFEAGKLVLE